MKNQYFGDIHDFQKYTLLKWFMQGCEKKLMIAWYLTDNDEKELKKSQQKDGEKRNYAKFKKCNEELFEFFEKNNFFKDIKKRSVEKIKKELICENVEFFSKNLDAYENRKEWFEKLKKEIDTNQCEIVFADPDNGIKLNNENSNKHIKLSEIKELWKMEKSLIIYQHFPMIDHRLFMAGIIVRIYEELKNINKPFVGVVYSQDVATVFILKTSHKKRFENLKEKIKECKNLKFMDVFEYTSKNFNLN